MPTGRSEIPQTKLMLLPKPPVKCQQGCRSFGMTGGVQVLPG
jgi:predicted metal-binding protein